MQRLFIRIGIIPCIAIIYLSIVYRRWSNLQELSPIMVYCLALGICIGIFLSIYEFKRPKLVTFFLTAPAPMLAYCVDLLSIALIGDANAQLPVRELIINRPSPILPDTVPIEIGPIIIELAIQIIFACLFGLFAVLGQIFGSDMRPKLNKLIVYWLSKRDVLDDAAQIRAAYISGFALVAGALIGGVSSVLAVAFS